MIATPSYQNQVSLSYHLASADAFMRLRQAGIQIEERHTSKDGLVARARMHLLNLFIANPNYTHVMWIDNDLDYCWEDIARMIGMNREFVCGVYRKRMAQMSFPCVYLQDPREPFKRDEHGCIQLKRAPGGFCLWRREAVYRMLRAYPERRCRIVDGGWFVEGNAHVYDFFPCPVDEGGMFNSEDYGMSDLFREAGGIIYCDPTIRLIHDSYDGRLGDYLKFENEDAA
jgi:hypothetical protein